jgi:hypothetical protein
MSRLSMYKLSSRVRFSFPRAVPHHAKIFLVALALYLIGYEKNSGIAGGLGAKEKDHRTYFRRETSDFRG